MEENNELNEQEASKLMQESECGSQPTRPGSSNPGDWDCQNGKWVWVENVGG